MAAEIPNRPLFRAQDVCELAGVQAYVLRSWEAEFPDLGIAKTPAGPRVYRRADVERVLRIKQLVFVDGLTLAGARRRLSEERPQAAADAVTDADVAHLLNEATRHELLSVRRGLSWILGVLSGNGTTPEDFVLKAPAAVAASPRGQRSSAAEEKRQASSRSGRSKPAKSSRPAKKATRGRRR